MSIAQSKKLGKILVSEKLINLLKNTHETWAQRCIFPQERLVNLENVLPHWQPGIYADMGNSKSKNETSILIFYIKVMKQQSALAYIYPISQFLYNAFLKDIKRYLLQ